MRVNEARTIERLPVDSSGLKSIGYAEDRQILSLEFTSGTVFHYYQVPPQVFEDLGAAESRGKFYSKNIRGKFVGKAMTGKCAKCGGVGLIGESCERQDVDHPAEVQTCGGDVREIDRVHKG